MILSILTGGIDLPKLDAKVSSLELALAEKYEETNKALADHIVNANARMTTIENVVASRALAKDVETLRLKADRLAGEILECADDAAKTRAVAVRAEMAVANLAATVAGLQTQITALTAAKVSEVKARKAPAKK